jgi:hypothetical protein
MEEMDMYYGFANYQTLVSPSLDGQQTRKLSMPGVRDRAIVFVNQVCNKLFIASYLGTFWSLEEN